jgi:hypothetical protein
MSSVPVITTRRRLLRRCSDTTQRSYTAANQRPQSGPLASPSQAADRRPSSSADQPSTDGTLAGVVWVGAGAKAEQRHKGENSYCHQVSFIE